MTAANAALKELYNDQVMQNLVYKDNPFLAMVPKRTDFGGKYKPIPIIIGATQGGSATFASAQAYSTAPELKSFLLTRVSDYSIAYIDNQTMLASATDKMAFIEGSKLVIDAAIRTATNSLASSLFRSGTGTIGRISDITTGVITLTNVADVVQFEINQALIVSTADGSGARATVGYVIGVDRSLGKVTMSTTLGGTAATPTNWTNTDYITRAGDIAAKASGLLAWLPSTAPTSSDSFYGVNRYADQVRLGGVLYDASGQSIEEGLQNAAALVAREGGTPSKCIMSFASYAALIVSLGSKVQYIDVKGPAEIGFRGVRIAGANTQIDCFPDRNCPPLKAFLLQMDTWKLESLGDAPQILRYGDGLEMLRQASADGSELRVGAYYNLACNAPGWNANVTLSA